MKKIKIIEIPSEIGAGTRGSSLSPDSIRIAALDFMSNFYNEYPVERVAHNNQLLFQAISSPHAKRIEGVLDMAEKIQEEVSRTITEDFFPIIVSGDHSNAIGTIAGIKKALPQSRLGVVWIDAHADLHTPYTTPSGNMHGMSLAASIGEDNIEQKAHELHENVTNYWNKLKNLNNQQPKLKGEDIVFISLRDYEKEEMALISKYNLHPITTENIRDKGVNRVVKEAIRQLKDCSHIYISFDVDSIDPEISKGTGTPVKNGIKEREAYDLVSEFVLHDKVCCFEITEVNPTLDSENLMSEIAFNILLRCANIKALN